MTPPLDLESLKYPRSLKGGRSNESCPIHFTEAELSHSQDMEGWNEVQDFFDHIDPLVKRDG